MATIQDASTDDDVSKKPEKELNVLQKFFKACSDIWKNPTARWVTLGGSLRFFEEFSVIYFLPSFYLRCFPEMKAQFSTLNALIQSLGGMTSIIASGILADRMSKRDKSAGSKLALWGTVIGIPAIAGVCLFKGVGFYTSLFFLAIKFLLTEGYMAPTISMMQATEKPENQGNVVSAYLCFLTMAGCISSVILG